MSNIAKGWYNKIMEKVGVTKKDIFYAVIDFEATCWKDAPLSTRTNMEIIEWGCVLVNYTGQEIGRFQSFIKPVIITQLSEFCISLTSIQQSDVDVAPMFTKVVEDFKVFISNYTNIANVVFCSWGFFDHKQLKHDCGYHEVPFIFEGNKHINVKNLYSEHFQTKRCGVGKALRHLGMKFQGSPHRGIDDAINIANMMKLIFFMKKEFNYEKHTN